MNKLKNLIARLFLWIPLVRIIYETRKTQTPIRFRTWFIQKVLGFNREAYWPVHFSSVVFGAHNVHVGIAAAPGNSNGCYIQGGGKIYIGDYTIIGPNVGIISSNHDLHDNQKKVRKVVRIEKYCWIGMGAVILPGVELGEFTIIAAGAIVTKSFPEGYCVVGGNPAKIIKQLDPSECVRYESDFEYHGYIKKDKFEKFRKKINV